MWAVVPVKSTSSHKSRLANVLCEQQRKHLMRAMATDVVTTLAAVEEIEKVLVVCSTSEFFQQPLPDKCEFLNLKTDDCLNTAVAEGLALAAIKGCRRVMVMHADLPLIETAEISDLISVSEQYDVTLLPCDGGEGTNVAVINPVSGFVPSYGKNSFQGHLLAAEKNRLRVNVYHSSTLGVDVDTVDDLEKVIAVFSQNTAYQASCTWRYLKAQKLLSNVQQIVEWAQEGIELCDDQSQALTAANNTEALMSAAQVLRDRGFGDYITYSKKVFIPLTHLCRDVCHYCTFAKVPSKNDTLFMSEEQVLAVARQGAAMGCKEALFTLGEKPELRYSAARSALQEMGFATTLEYVAHMALLVFKETGLLPHINAGCMDEAEIDMLRPVSASMGIMLESSSTRLCEKGMPHYGSPDKEPKHRLRAMALLGEKKVPLTTGILIGIGETRYERIESLLAIRELHRKYGHIQEVIIQNFRAKPDTKMAAFSEPDKDELLWTIAVGRMILGSEMSIQVPPNLNQDSLDCLIKAGINDWGGVSPLTPDFVNPEAPWPQINRLAEKTAAEGKWLHERLTIYPSYILAADEWCDNRVLPAIKKLADAEGYACEYDWCSGVTEILPAEIVKLVQGVDGMATLPVSDNIRRILEKSSEREPLSRKEIAELFTARGKNFQAVCVAADNLRKELKGDAVSYVVNRNINYTNICTYHCEFCAFSKGRVRENLREKPYNLSLEDIQQRALEAQLRGATEVCLQGGIHPAFDGHTYLDICKAVHQVAPDLHIHAFSPLEITHGAETLGMQLDDYLAMLKDAGLRSLPGTAAEILHDEVRDVICADKINTEQWLGVMREAHKLGIGSTATIMFGHVDNYLHWANHLLEVLNLQRESGGFTEFVPLPFVAHESPIYRRGQARLGPSLRESILMHAVSRLVFGRDIQNIQASWVKLGAEGAKLALHAGANDLGGVLMNESITRAAGATHGQELTESSLVKIIVSAQRQPARRNTLYDILDTVSPVADDGLIAAVSV